MRRARVPHDVVLEADVFDRRPRRGRAVRTDGEHDREARLSSGPVVLEQVAVDLDEAGVLELEQILHDPRSGTPRDGPGDVVAADDDVARDQLIDGRSGSAEQDADPGRLDVVVLDDEGARPVPARDPLCLLADQPDAPDVAVPDVRVGAVERDAALLPPRLVTPDHDAVEDQVGRHECPIPLHRITQSDDIATARAGEAKADEAPVMGARGGPQGRAGVGRSHRREQRLVRQVDARRAAWQLRVRGRGANGDVGAARLHRQDEVAVERRTRLQLDDLAGLRLVQRGLEVAAGADHDRAGRPRRSRPLPASPPAMATRSTSYLIRYLLFLGDRAPPRPWRGAPAPANASSVLGHLVCSTRRDEPNARYLLGVGRSRARV